MQCYVGSLWYLDGFMEFANWCKEREKSKLHHILDHITQNVSFEREVDIIHFCIFIARSLLHAPTFHSCSCRLVRILWNSDVTSEVFKNIFNFCHLPNPVYRKTDKKSEATANSGTRQINFLEQGRVGSCFASIKLKPGNQRIRTSGQPHRTTQRFVWLFLLLYLWVHKVNCKLANYCPTQWSLIHAAHLH